MSSRNLLLLVAAIGLGSCSTMYKSGQTPDDVYYSPAPQQRVVASNNNYDNEYNDDDGDYVTVRTDQDRTAYSGEDNYLRMKVRNRTMWSSLDYYDAMMYSPYGGFGWGGMGMYNPYMMSSFYNPYFGGSRWGLGLGFGGLGWGYSSIYHPFYSYYNPYSFYNPYYGGGWYGGGHYAPGVISMRPASSIAPRTTNLGRYGGASRNGAVNNTGRNAPVRVYRNNDNNYVNPRSGSSPSRRVNDNSSFNNNNRSSRSYEPSRSNSAPSRSFSSPSSGSGRSSGGGSAPSRSPGRGGR